MQRGRLDPLELTEAALLGDLALAMVVAGWFLPLGGVLIVGAAAPFGVLAARRRLRAVVVAGLVTVLLAGIALGPGAPQNLALDAVVGAVVGVLLRRGWGRGRALLVAVPVVWAPTVAISVGGLLLFGNARRLLFAQVRATARGLTRLPTRPRFPLTAANWLIAHWVAVLAAAELVWVAAFVVVAWRLTHRLLRRLSEEVPPPPLPPSDAGRCAGPVPVRLAEVGYRYPTRAEEALRDVDLQLPAGGLHVVVGPNGSGKSTLTLLLAGMAPSRGQITRPGDCALGRVGGSAIIRQRPESQVLGVRVRDDVLWGVPPEEPVDVEHLLGLVELAGFAERETATLSGGQLQRVAIAAALARRPQLLLSDESTSMLDPPARAAVMRALRAVADAGTTVVHVTHREADLADADTVVRVEAGRVLAGPR